MLVSDFFFYWSFLLVPWFNHFTFLLLFCVIVFQIFIIWTLVTVTFSLLSQSATEAALSNTSCSTSGILLCQCHSIRLIGQILPTHVIAFSKPLLRPFHSHVKKVSKISFYRLKKKDNTNHPVIYWNTFNGCIVCLWSIIIIIHHSMYIKILIK